MKPMNKVNGICVVSCPRVRCDVTGVQTPSGRAVRLSTKDQHLLFIT